MNEFFNTVSFMDMYGVSAFLSIIPAIILAFIADGRLHNVCPECRRFKWGYYRGFSAMIAGLIFFSGFFIGSKGSFSTYPSETQAEIIALSVHAVLSIFLGYYIIKRSRGAMVAETILSFNIIIWIINSIYIKHRWAELSRNKTSEEYGSIHKPKY